MCVWTYSGFDRIGAMRVNERIRGESWGLIVSIFSPLSIGIPPPPPPNKVSAMVSERGLLKSSCKMFEALRRGVIGGAVWGENTVQW